MNAPKLPPAINLMMTPAAADLVRKQLGTLPHDQVRGLIDELEGQVNKQVHDFNAPPVTTPAPDAPEAVAPQAVVPEKSAPAPV